jgi:REP element-mobilizing transposase RayT
MARPLRLQYPGAVYHISSRGNEKKAIFKEDRDREAFLDLLQQVNKRYHWICHAYCLMDNHYHLLIETPEGNLSLGMRQLNGVYTQLFNARHKRSGHLFQGRYQAIHIEKESHLLEVCRYVVLNPVRARLRKRPEEWTWSSYPGTAGSAPAHRCLSTDWVLGQFGGTRRKAQEEYRRYVQEGMGKQTPWKDVRGQVLLGREEFVEKLGSHLRTHQALVDIPKSQRYASRPGLEKIFSEKVLQSKEVRNKKIGEAVEKYGYTQREIAGHLGLYFTSVSRIMKERSTK